MVGEGSGKREAGSGRAGGAVPALRIVDLLRDVKDPEVPVLDIVELGIVRGAELEGDRVWVDVTPTYSGCPAMQVIEDEIRRTLQAAGFAEVEVRTVFQPVWTTDWISQEAREKLRAYGIAPPGPAEAGSPITLGPTVRLLPCPFCGSSDTELRSEFGATACKSLHYCSSCRQPFEHFKAI